MPEVPSLPCLSPRCRQAGRCNCLHVYDDGSPVPGSGQADDPYVHEHPRIQCIYTHSGQQIVPDSNRCVTLPNSVARVVLSDGTILEPNNQGRIDLSALNFREFTFRDSEGTSYIVEDKSTVILSSDGDSHTGFTPLNVEVPTIVGNKIVFPQQKLIKQSGYDLENRPGGSFLASRPLANYALLEDFSLPRKKTTNYHMDFSVGLMENVANLDPTIGELLTFKLSLIPVLGSGLTTTSLHSVAYWSPDYSFGYRHYNFSTTFTGIGPEAVSTFDIQYKVMGNNLISTRAVYIEYLMIITWV